MEQQDERDLDTWQRTDAYIERLKNPYPLRAGERRDLELLLRRYRKASFGSALTDREIKEGRSEINP